MVTRSPVEKLKGYMVRERSGTHVLDKEQHKYGYQQVCKARVWPNFSESVGSTFAFRTRLV